jgi:CubicO group peptidase (beta-lactamase class C family)
VVSWRVHSSRTLAHNLRAALPDTAIVAVATADDEGYSVELSDGCSADVRFEVGSITKTMTGAVLASLVDDGIVGVDDEIGRWLDAGQHADITLRQLATHTSGLPRLSPSHVLGAPDPYEFLTPDVAEEEPRRTPWRPRDAEHDYSNFGFHVLGLALERADGTAFGELLYQRVFHPLGMTSAGIPGHGGGTRIPGHADGAPTESWSHHLMGAGGFEASAEDMVRYLSACLTPPDSAAGWAIRMAQNPHFRIDPLRSMGFGWVLGPPGYLGHDGATSGFRSMLGIKPAAHRAAAVFVNEHNARGLPLAVRDSLDAP